MHSVPLKTASRGAHITMSVYEHTHVTAEIMELLMHDQSCLDGHSFIIRKANAVSQIKVDTS